MKKSFLKNSSVLVFLFISSFNAIAQTNVSGFISSNTTWNLAGSPYIVIANSLVSGSYTLTIDPGVLVKFNDSCALQIDGELIAIGTAQNRIIFTSNQTVPAAGDWAKIHFSDSCVSAAFDTAGNYISGSIMKYCDVSYGGQLGFGEVHVEGSSPYFNNCKILNSKADGIHDNRSSCSFDSSVVSNCDGYGLYFHDSDVNSCGLTITGDSIMNNRGGGIYFDSQGDCPVIYKNNYFFGNHRAIYSGGNLSGTVMTGNYFVNNDHVVVEVSGNNHFISENYFIDNQGTILAESTSGTGQITIQCNFFLNNQISGSVIDLSLWGNTDAFIRNNLFDSNYVSVALGGSIVDVVSATFLANLYFTNNTIRNSSSLFYSCFRIDANINTLIPQHFITHNDFINNTAQKCIYVEGSNFGTNVSSNFLYIKHNNFLNPGIQYEVYNDIPYGSPNILADSNYWGTTNTGQIDAVLYDYFDFANQSVVYYLPILTSAAEVDTTCPPLGIGINELEKTSSSMVFPNPFSLQATIRLDRAIRNGTLQLYNMFGQMVKSTRHLSGNEIPLTRENLNAGAYFYEVIEEQNKIYQGKIVLY